MEKRNMADAIKKEALLWLVVLLGAYIITAMLLLLLAFIVYQFSMGEKITGVCIVIIYVLTNFAAGFFMGKKKKVKKYLSGMMIGIAYFGMLVLMSLLCHGGLQDFAGDFFTTLAICAGAGTLGGMLS